MVPAVTGTGVEKSDLLPAGGGLAGERRRRQQRAGAGPQAADVGAGVAGALVEPDAGDLPVAARRNCTPRFTALVSFASTAPVRRARSARCCTGTGTPRRW